MKKGRMAKMMSLVVLGLAGLVLVGCSPSEDVGNEEDVESFDVEFDNNTEFEEESMNLSDVEKEEAEHAAKTSESAVAPE